MTSEERRELRYQRRKAKRQEKRKKLKPYDCFEQVFSYKNLYAAYKRCRRNVGWKSSTQKYIAMAPVNVINTYNRLMAGKYKSEGFYEFDLFERGKHRHIKSITIGERVVQSCLCDNALVPMLTRTFIHDNGASMKGKGYHFAVNRLVRHLQYHYRKHGNDGYVLLFDFSKFFESVSHSIVKGILKKEFSDERIYKLTEQFIDAFGDIGMGLGSHISQVLALASANRLDHVIKEGLRIKCYGRYMDDGYLIHESLEHLEHCLDVIRKICIELGITLNEKKTHIAKLSRGFTWLKVRFYLTGTGKVVKKIYKRSITVMRRKLKKLRKLVDIKKITQEDVHASFQSWKGYAEHFDATHTIRNMELLYFNLFGKEDNCITKPLLAQT